jgi:hypothetical protein
MYKEDLCAAALALGFSLSCLAKAGRAAS